MVLASLNQTPLNITVSPIQDWSFMKTTNYSQINPNDVLKYASLIADEISLPMLIKFDHDFDYLIQYAVTSLRQQTTRYAKVALTDRYRVFIFTHYIQHSDLSKQSPLYNAGGDELKKRRLYQLL